MQTYASYPRYARFQHQLRAHSDPKSTRPSLDSTHRSRLYRGSAEPYGGHRIVDHRQISLACHDFAGRDRVPTGSVSDNLLGERGRHDGSFPAACIAARQPNILPAPAWSRDLGRSLTLRIPYRCRGHIILVSAIFPSSTRHSDRSIVPRCSRSRPARLPLLRRGRRRSDLDTDLVDETVTVEPVEL